MKSTALYTMLLVLAGMLSFAQPAAALAPRPLTETVTNLIQPECRDFVVYEILKLFQLDHFPNHCVGDVVTSKKNDYYVLKVTLPGHRGTFQQPHAKNGFEFLIQELYPASEKMYRFDFIFNKQGYLIAIFPGISYREMQERNISNLDWSYLDLTPYYFKMPLLHDEAAKKAWNLLAYEMQQNKDIFCRYLASRFFDTEFFKSLDEEKVPYFRNPNVRFKKPYVFVEFDPRSNTIIQFKNFFPSEYSQLSMPSYRKTWRLILPVFPTVYPPTRYFHEDSGYYYAILNGSKRNQFQIHAGSKALLMGPGSGFDTWLTWLKTKTTVSAAGLNPMEVANTKTTAALLNIPVRVVRHDNVISPDNETVFPGEQFDLFLWNMPVFTSGTCPPVPARFRKAWDNNFNLLDLARFFDGLKRKLKTNGKALLWNKLGLAKFINPEDFSFSTLSETNDLNVFFLSFNRGTEFYL